MNSIVADAESLVRLTFFLIVLLALAVLEYRFPRRELHYPKAKRWITNYSISLLNTLFVRALLPLVGVGAASFAAGQGWGVLNYVGLPAWLEIALFLLIFDLTIYFQHRIFHRVPFLWKLHRMHHSDPDYDVSTGNRFHPLSIIISSLIKLGLILAMGPAAVAVLMAEVLLNTTSMFNHSNLKISSKVEVLIRYAVVTPDMCNRRSITCIQYRSEIMTDHFTQIFEILIFLIV